MICIKKSNIATNLNRILVSGMIPTIHVLNCMIVINQNTRNSVTILSVCGMNKINFAMN